VHSLALEDVLHEHRDIQSKADYYPDHLFIRVLCHSVCPHDGNIQLTGPDHHFSSMQKGRSKFTVPPAYGPADVESGNSPYLRNISYSPTTSTNPLIDRCSSLPLFRSLELRTRFSRFNAWGARNDNAVRFTSLSFLISHGIPMDSIDRNRSSNCEL
jgi:hypothetical protein